MSNSYIHSASRVKALEGSGYFVSNSQLEQLLGAQDMDEFFSLLNETFLEAHMEESDKRELGPAFDKSLHDAKSVLDQIAPEPEVLDVLWYKYEFANLKVILKGIYKGLDDEEIINLCYAVYKHEPQDLLDAVKKEKFEFLPLEVSEAIGLAKNAQDTYTIDFHMDAGYLKLIKNFADNNPYSFLKNYVSLHSDFFSIKSKLRKKALEGYVETPSMDAGEDNTPEDEVLENLHEMGGEEFWQEAITEYKEGGHFTLLEKRFDDYILKFLKEESMKDLFSPATLFAFFEARKNDIKIVRSLYVFKTTGRDADFIKKFLRNTFVYE